MLRTVTVFLFGLGLGVILALWLRPADSIGPTLVNHRTGGDEKIVEGPEEETSMEKVDRWISQIEAIENARKALAEADVHLPEEQPVDVFADRVKGLWVVTFLFPDSPERNIGGPRPLFIARASVNALTGEVQIPMEVDIG